MWSTTNFSNTIKINDKSSHRKICNVVESFKLSQNEKWWWIRSNPGHEQGSTTLFSPLCIIIVVIIYRYSRMFPLFIIANLQLLAIRMYKNCLKNEWMRKKHRSNSIQSPNILLFTCNIFTVNSNRISIKYTYLYHRKNKQHGAKWRGAKR